MRLRGRSSCSVGGGGLMACAVSIGCVAALRPPHDAGSVAPKIPDPSRVGGLSLPPSRRLVGRRGRQHRSEISSILPILLLWAGFISSPPPRGVHTPLGFVNLVPSDRLPSRASPTAAVTLQGGRTAKRHLPDTYQYERRERQRGIVIDNDAVVDC